VPDPAGTGLLLRITHPRRQTRSALCRVSLRQAIDGAASEPVVGYHLDVRNCRQSSDE